MFFRIILLNLTNVNNFFSGCAILVLSQTTKQIKTFYEVSMKNKVISLLKKNKPIEDIALDFKIDIYDVPYRTDFYYLLSLCKKLGLSNDDFNDIVDETFDDFGLKHF